MRHGDLARDDLERPMPGSLPAGVPQLWVWRLDDGGSLQ
jgi:hypothetical protein